MRSGFPLRPLAVALAVLSAATLTGLATRAGAAPDGLKVALVTPGPVTDAGWNALAKEGLDRIAKEIPGSTIQHVQQGSPQKFEDDLKDFARGGAQLVFAHGFEYQEACEKVAAKFPDTVFVVTSGKNPFGKNGASIGLRLDEACYLAGILAGHVTKTKKIGAVGGMAIPPVKKGFEAFARAAKKGRPDVSMAEPAYLGTWDDAAKGREQALALIGAGCDVVIHNADHAGLGVFNAAKEKGIFAIGSNRDQNAVEESTVLASATLDIPRAMLDLAKEVLGKTFKPRELVLDMKSGYADLTLNEKLKDKIPQAARDEIAAAKKAILAGTLDPLKD